MLPDDKNRAERGRPPYGFRVHDGRIEPDPQERRVVALIDELCGAPGSTYRSVAQALNDRGIASRDGGRWGPSAVHRIANRELFAARRETAKTTGTESSRILFAIDDLLARMDVDSLLANVLYGRVQETLDWWFAADDDDEPGTFQG